jgi:hypothetical protein
MDGNGRALDNIFVERLWRNIQYDGLPQELAIPNRGSHQPGHFLRLGGWS